MFETRTCYIGIWTAREVSCRMLAWCQAAVGLRARPVQSLLTAVRTSAGLDPMSAAGSTTPEGLAGPCFVLACFGH